MAALPLPEPQDAPETLEACLPLALPQRSHGGPESVIALALNGVSSPITRRQYGRALWEFAFWRGTRSFTRATVQEWKVSLEASGASASTVNQKLAAVRKVAREAAANGLLESGQAAGILQVGDVKQRGVRSGNWLTKQQTQALIQAPAADTLMGKRDRCALAILVGCGLRREEAAQLTFEHVQQREGRWVICDLRGKGGRIRSVPVPNWVKAAVDNWANASQLSSGRVLRGMNRHDQITHETLTGTAIFDLAVKYGNEIGVKIAPHDLRRTCAKLCRKTGGELEQIQMLLGHASIQTTERYLGTQQDLANAPNDRMGLRWRDGE